MTDQGHAQAGSKSTASSATSSATSSLPEDHAARERALDPTQSFIVQAPAGSGKTGLLTQRFLQLLAQVDSPEEIISITFTRKAAGEMRSRILAALHSAENENDPGPDKPYEQKTWQLARAALEQDRQHKWQLLLNPARLRVQTIDSLCQMLSRQMPLLSQFGSLPALVEDAGDMYREAAQAVLDQLETRSDLADPIGLLLAHRDNRVDQLETLLAEMLARRDQWLRHIVKQVTGEYDPDSRRQEIEQVFQQLVNRVLADIDQVMPAEVKTQLPALAAFAAEHSSNKKSSIFCCKDLQEMPAAHWSAIDKWMSLSDLLLTDGQWRKQRGVNVKLGFPAEGSAGDPVQKETFKQNKQSIQQILETLSGDENLRRKLAAVKILPAPAYTDKEWQLVDGLFQLLVNAVAQLQLVFGQRGEVDFCEMAIRADRALGDELQPSDLSLKLDYRIKHLLVDEFQDTSQNQYTLFSKLTTGWESGDGRTLFLVGDPMQSIYRFREAEVGLFLQAWEGQLGSVPLTPLTLSVNFRSQAGIIDWVNDSFPLILPPQSDKQSGAVHYTVSVAHRDHLPGDAVVIYPQLTKDDTWEAQQVLSVIEESRQQNPDSTIAILVRSKAHVFEIAHLLQRHGHTYQAVEIDKLSNRPVVQDLLSLSRALLHPADRISWLAILRAPWCGLSLSDLLELTADDPVAPVISLLRDEQRLSRLSDDGRLCLQRVLPLLETALRQRGRQFLRGWIEGVWLSLGGPACLHNETDRENADVFLNLLQKIEDTGIPATPEILEDKVSALFAHPDANADGRLQIMSMHKSKGLEFDSVILPGLGKATGRDQARLLYWLEQPGESGQPELIFGPIGSSGKAQNQTVEYIKHLDKEKDRLESGRLLYVAATRARQHLHLFGHTGIDRKECEVKQPAESTLLHQLWPVVKDDYEEFQANLSENEKESLTETETEIYIVSQKPLQRLASDWSMPPAPESVPAMTRAEIENEELLEFDWASESARLVGTVVHRHLEYLSRKDISTVLQSDLPRLQAISLQMLKREGLPQAMLPQAVERVSTSLQRILSDQRGRWILSTEHEDAHSEYAISSYSDGKVYHMVVDRTFIDEQGVRWIIDYKTGSHSGGGLDEFLDREKDRYCKQLERYAAAMARREKSPIRLALYFPLMQGWREWGYEL